MTTELQGNAWFGDEAWAPLCEYGPQVERPVGELCLYCEEAIEDGENGIMMPLLDVGGPSIRPMHSECNLRSVAGSLAHLEHRCACYGGTDHDTPGLTRRQEAIAVENWIRWHGL